MRPARLVRPLFGACRVLLLVLVLLAAFAVPAVLAALLAARLGDTAPDDPVNLAVGAVCGLIAWLFIAVFHFKMETVTLVFPDRGSFTRTVTAHLNELGFLQHARTEGELVFRPTFQSLAVGRVRVQVDGDAARVTGPKVSLERLRKRLRVACHLENASRVCDGRPRLGENILRRVQLSLRVSGEQWRGIAHEVTQVLANEGAEVLCDVNILAHSDAGLREDVVDRLVLDRLRRRSIPVVVLKEQVHAARAAEPAAPARAVPAPG
jgi:hypothetical protein